MGATPRVVMNTLIRPRLADGCLPFHHALSPHLFSVGLNVAKHETMLASSRHYSLYMGRSWALAYSTVLSLSQDFILHMLLLHAVALAQFLLPAFPSLWMFFGKYMSISPLKVLV